MCKDFVAEFGNIGAYLYKNIYYLASKFDVH